MAVVETSYGRLRGSDENGLAVFRGIPFAAPPVGELRWRSPQPPEPWQGEREATQFGYAAPQDGGPLGGLLGITVGETNEDCLTLNVWTPGCDDAKRPVMVWIHGGAFVIGAGSQEIYNGTKIAERDVVVVTINYRLGVFGFLRGIGSLDGASGNQGLEDQVAALRWVRDEIARFGGDPDNVTIFGESAGAISIGYLLGIPAADGLYQRAILQSGGAWPERQNADTESLTADILGRLGLTPETAEQARSLPSEKVYEAQQQAVIARAAGGVTAIPFGPVLDGEVIAERPLTRLAAGVHRDVTIMTGTARDEMTLFLGLDPSFQEVNDETLPGRVEAYHPGSAAAAIEAYRAARTERNEPADAKALLIAIATDWLFRYPDVRIAETQAGQNANTYMYRFDWESPAMGGILGACHAIDLGFTFGTHSVGESAQFYGTGETADRLSERVIDAWTAFARTGDPSTPELAWPQYDSASRTTMLFNAENAAVEGPGEGERAFLDSLASVAAG